MTKILLLSAALLTTPLMAQASNYVCASMGHAEDAVREALSLDPSDAVPTAEQGEDEYQGGGQFVYRKILVGVYDGHTGRTTKYVVSYSIVKSFDGPDNGDYCDLTAVEKKSTVCARDPELKLCK